ncbi:MAG: ABC transporter permease, partial [Chloroflexota bacterium]|nr:ABC transporter permease [Chloroflexota bacterium]
ILILLFSLQWRLFPSGGAGDAPGQVFHALVLPSIATGLALAGTVARITRSSLLSVLAQDYVRTARAKGLHRLVVLSRHALTNALIPVVTIIGLNVGILLGGVVVIETVFTRPGIGRLLLDSISTRDYPVIQGIMIVLVVTVVLLNLLTDLLYGVVDPRVRV